LSNKIGLSKAPAVSSFPDRDFNRLQYLCACLAAVKAFLENYLTYPVTKYHTLTVPMTLQIVWNSGTLQQLSSFEHPDWNVGMVSEAIDLADYLQKLASKMSTVKDAMGYDVHTSERLDFWSQHIKTMLLMTSTFARKVGDPEYQEGNPGVHDQPAVETQSYSSFPPGEEFMDFMDDVWMGPSDYQRW
jgi:hypothetical protein